MKEETKIEFSNDEAALMNNAAVILTKNSIITKLYALFGELADDYSEKFGLSKIPPEILTISPKISKGENYLGLPFVVLDYPRFFTKKDILAVRNLFWWGHYFSITLHLKGKYKNAFNEAVKKNFELLSREEFHLAVSQNEWQHHIDEAGFPAIKDMDEQQFVRRVDESDFLKLSSRIPLPLHGKVKKEFLKKMEVILFLLNY